MRRLAVVPERRHDGDFTYEPTMTPGESRVTEPQRVVPTEDGRSVTIDGFTCSTART